MDKIPDRAAITAANRAAWDAAAPLHLADPGWPDLLAAAAKPGFSVLDACLTDTLRGIGIAGRRAGQVGCNNARELLSLASLGADPVLGVDQSAAFLDQARQLARAAGLAPEFVAADIYALPDGVPTCDLILITIGVLGWMPDLPGFFAAVAGLMAPGSVLVIYETHPFMEVFNPDAARPHEPFYSYFDARPQAEDDAITYDGKDHGKGETGYWTIHTMGAIVTAVLDAGLTLERLTEHPHSIREPQYDIFEGRAVQIPMSFTLVARR